MECTRLEPLRPAYKRTACVCPGGTGLLFGNSREVCFGDADWVPCVERVLVAMLAMVVETQVCAESTTLEQDERLVD